MTLRGTTAATESSSIVPVLIRASPARSRGLGDGNAIARDAVVQRVGRRVAGDDHLIDGREARLARLEAGGGNAIESVSAASG